MMIENIQTFLDNYDADVNRPDPEDIWTIEFNLSTPNPQRYTLMVKGDVEKHELARELRSLADSIDYGIQGTPQ